MKAIFGFFLFFFLMTSEQLHAAKIIKVIANKKIIILGVSSSESADIAKADRILIRDRKERVLSAGRVLAKKRNRLIVRVKRIFPSAKPNLNVSIKKIEMPSPLTQKSDKFFGVFIKTNPIVFVKPEFVGLAPLGDALIFSGTLGFTFLDDFSLGAQFAFGSTSNEVSSFSTYAITPALAYHFSGAQNDGFYLKVQGGYQSIGFSFGLDDFSSSLFKAGGFAGYQLIWSSGINLSLGLGANYFIFSNGSDAGTDTADVTGFLGQTSLILLAFDLTVGFMF